MWARGGGREGENLQQFHNKIWEGHWKIEAIRTTRGVYPGINNSGGGLLARERATSCEARGGRGIRVSEVKRALVHCSKNVGRPSLFAADPSWWNNDESFLAGKFLPPWTKVNEETLSLTSSDCLFFLDPILFSWVFFVRLGERGRLFFPNDVFKKNDGKRSSRGDLSSDFYSSGGRCCRVIQEICVTRWKFNFKLNFPRSHGSDTLWKGRELKSQLGKSQLFTVYFSVAIIRIEFFLFFKEASTRVGTSKFHRMICGNILPGEHESVFI